MIKLLKLFFQFSKFAKIDYPENVLEDKNVKMNIREQKLIYSMLYQLQEGKIKMLILIVILCAHRF